MTAMENSFDNPAGCVGSGYCCMKSPCMISVQVYGIHELIRNGRCPSLRWDEGQGRYFCNLAEQNEEIRRSLGAGTTGCCSPLNSWRRDVQHRPEVRYEGYPTETGG